MNNRTHREVVEALWQAFDAFDFEAAGELLHDDFVCEWPQSRERIRGRENFVAVNANYPGKWRVRIEKIVAQGDDVVTEVTLRHGDEVVVGISFFELQDGKIIRLREHWPEPVEAPAWRAQWVERT